MGNPVIDRANDFYPFGLEFGGSGMDISNSISPNYTYSFQGQEKQADSGWNSYKWRNYDPTMGRFFNVDPLTEKYNTWSPYAFSGNRVVDARELEGLEPVIFKNEGGKMEVNYYTKVIAKKGTTKESINNHLSEVSGVLSQNGGLKINMVLDNNSSFGIDMTKKNQGYTITTNDKGEQIFSFVKGNAFEGDPVNQTVNSDGSVRATTHEIAHALGLSHIFEKNPIPNTLENVDNLMNSDANKGESMTPANGTKLLPPQIDIIKKVIESVQPQIDTNKKNIENVQPSSKQ